MSKHCFREGRAIIRHGVVVAKNLNKVIRTNGAGLNAKKTLAELKGDITQTRRDRCVPGGEASMWQGKERGFPVARAIYLEDLAELKKSISRARKVKALVEKGEAVTVDYARRINRVPDASFYGRLRSKRRRR